MVAGGPVTRPLPKYLGRVSKVSPLSRGWQKSQGAVLTPISTGRAHWDSDRSGRDRMSNEGSDE